MPLIPWKPFFEPFEDFEKYFKDDYPLIMPDKIKGFIPAADVYEEGNDIIVEVPLAGVDPENVEVNIENDVLSIKGKSEHKNEVDEKDYYRREIRQGNFYRTVALPAHVDGDKAKAEAQNGLLKITVPRLVGTKKKSVPVVKATAKKTDKKKK